MGLPPTCISSILFEIGIPNMVYGCQRIHLLLEGCVSAFLRILMAICNFPGGGGGVRIRGQTLSTPSGSVHDNKP